MFIEIKTWIKPGIFLFFFFFLTMAINMARVPIYYIAHLQAVENDYFRGNGPTDGGKDPLKEMLIDA